MHFPALPDRPGQVVAHLLRRWVQAEGHCCLIANGDHSQAAFDFEPGRGGSEGARVGLGKGAVVG